MKTFTPCLRGLKCQRLGHPILLNGCAWVIIDSLVNMDTDFYKLCFSNAQAQILIICRARLFIASKQLSQRRFIKGGKSIDEKVLKRLLDQDCERLRA